MNKLISLDIPAEHALLLLHALSDYPSILDRRIAEQGFAEGTDQPSQLRWLRRYIESKTQAAGVTR